MAGEGNRKILKATSFYDGGYRGSWSCVRGLEEAGGSVCGNYVSGYRISEFSIQDYLDLLGSTDAQAIGATFSTYLSELFMNALKAAGPGAVNLPFYCSPFMAEELILSKCDFPGGTFHVVVPWASSIENEEQKNFTETIRKEKNKQANLFHLLGWEAGIAAEHIFKENAEALKNWSFESPRGKVTFHPDTHFTYAPLYSGKIVSGENGKCRLLIDAQIPIDAAEHAQVIFDRPEMVASGWKNNYFCS
jgi:branched-chain amino acid transport system substrate-binding protein